MQRPTGKSVRDAASCGEALSVRSAPRARPARPGCRRWGAGMTQSPVGDDPVVTATARLAELDTQPVGAHAEVYDEVHRLLQTCLLYTSDAADEEDSVDLGGRRIIKQKTK